MKCPKCGNDSTVTQSRKTGHRRRQCLNPVCRCSFHTQEFVVEPMPHGGDRHSQQFKDSRGFPVLATLVFDDKVVEYKTFLP